MSTGRNRSIIIKSDSEIAILLEANRIVARTLDVVERSVEPGISTLELDKIAEDVCLRNHGKPAFKGYRGFPGSLCVSINEEVVHGIPHKNRRLRKGDIVSLDFGAEYKGYYGDSASTIAVGQISAEVQRLIDVTKTSLDFAIRQATVGNRVGDISKAVQEHVESAGFSVVRQFVGHGIGQNLHEAPEVPNFYQGESTPRLVAGMVLAIEPMVNMGMHRVKVMKDGWTVITVDKRPSAHYEHSVVVTENGPLILSARS